MLDRPSRKRRLQRFVQLVDRRRRTLETEIDEPVVDAAVIDDAAGRIDGSLGGHRHASELHQRMLWIAESLRRARVGESIHVLDDRTALVCRIRINETE